MPPTTSPDSCILFMVRHGATDNNLADPPLLQGRTDVPLSVAGHRQAGRTAELLAHQTIRRVYASPLLRARQTAEVIAKPHRLNVEIVDGIQEIDVGDWEGRSWQEIAVSEPQRYHQFMADPAKHGYAGGENVTDLFRRVQPAMEELLASNLGEQIVVVGHNLVNRAFLAQLIGLPLAQVRSVNQDNCGVSVARYRKNEIKLLSMNSIFHLYD
ncbi:MAG: histidine phosphatase family protein [Pirellulaceae bacterium]|jgi:broad specificity phosphatase PhoE|nr:histidine phosphatase family protein [Pirellulaceae bacterium]MDP6557819.1 histidine phosphatase family protein [Pirellulaceae bacterium]MDP6723286.1 histidine phosphatase family protein [Pirellulaceae bacterium]